MARSGDLNDLAARKDELIRGALDGSLLFPPYFHLLTKYQDREELQKFVMEHPMVMTLNSMAHTYNYPNEVFWRDDAQNAFGHLQYVQMLPESERRKRQILHAAEAVVNAEQHFEMNGESAPGWIRPTAQGKIDIRAADQVVIADADVQIRKLCQKLNEVGQCLPILPVDEEGIHYARLGSHFNLQSAISLNLPHALDAQCGSWRDWILGMTILLADGTIVKTGSQVVKNVAGYDAHKLFVGARGTLGLILDVTLKTIPKDALPKHNVEIRRRVPKSAGADYRWPTLWIQRTRPSDFAQCVHEAGECVLEIDWESSTLWADVPYEQDLRRYPHDWVMRRGCREKNVQITDPAAIHFMKRAKKALDPHNKFNPGALGVV